MGELIKSIFGIVVSKPWILSLEERQEGWPQSEFCLEVMPWIPKSLGKSPEALLRQGTLAIVIKTLVLPSISIASEELFV